MKLSCRWVVFREIMGHQTIVSDITWYTKCAGVYFKIYHLSGGLRLLVPAALCQAGNRNQKPQVTRQDYILMPTGVNKRIIIQSTLVISNSLISNYRLSRSETLVPVLTRNYDNR